MYDITADKLIDIFRLQNLIRNNPQKNKIQELWTLNKGDLEYETLKQSLPNISPHGIFSGTRANENIIQFSGYLFFDIDVKVDDKTCNELKALVIEKHSDKVCMVAKSVGGKGICFYIRLSNPEKITAHNFTTINTYFRESVFADLNPDPKVKDIQRIHFIPYDEEVYINNSVEIEIPDTIIDSVVDDNKKINSKNNNSKKCVKSCIKVEAVSCNTTVYSFPEYIDINILFDKWQLKTKYDYRSDEDFVIEVTEVHKVFIPKRIPEGKRHKIFRAIINGIMFLNYKTVGVSLLEMQSFINYFNLNNTMRNPLDQKEMLRTVEREYNNIIISGKAHVKTKIKSVHTNPKLPRKVRQKIGSQKFGELTVQKSINIIQCAIDVLKAQQKKLTKTEVLKLINQRMAKGMNGLSYSTIRTHWDKAIADLQHQKQLMEDKDIPKQLNGSPQDLKWLQDTYNGIIPENPMVALYLPQHDVKIFTRNFFELQYTDVTQDTITSFYEFQFKNLEDAVYMQQRLNDMRFEKNYIPMLKAV